MTVGWTPEEWENRRRIVMFKKSQSGSRLTATFRAVPVNERPPNSICVSCIWWEERHECFVTSVDTIHLLEQLVVSPNRFTVEEKNRIRRNLEGFKPLTVSKAKADSEDFFKIIMGFGNPKPRNIEKDRITILNGASFFAFPSHFVDAGKRRQQQLRHASYTDNGDGPNGCIGLHRQ
ncbi:putative transcriptional regulator medusa [Diaporthe ampelina]|uniref:Putative transcriptional regulator medusa n=1 Tax=Diaporthe ampelina TaxID=1214573 RepID=A0A0G2FD32_9PEZI|nr:putative transcriptional regulator medusa [Diaporthe ampelina]